MEMYRRTFAEVNLEHLFHNYSVLKSFATQDRFFCPMVKANAYGHGDVQVTEFLQNQGVGKFGVCLIEEGLLLRQAGIRADILVFRGFDKFGAQKIVDLQLTPVISTWQQLELLENCADEVVKIHIKFDTGMNRLGFPTEDAEKIFQFLKKSKKLKIKAVISHFYCGEDAYDPMGHSSRQAGELKKIVDFFSPFDIYSHLLNSGGIASLAKVSREQNKDHYLNSYPWGFRPGLSLYGYDSSPLLAGLELKPVMTLKSVVNNIREVRLGESVSYGATWKAKRDSRIAVVPLGYADGFHRLLSNRGTALFAGASVPIIGRICMDFLMLDVTDVVSSANINRYDEEEIIFFGYDQTGNLLSAQTQASQSETISWELLTSVSERVPRKFKPFRQQGFGGLS